MLLPSLLYYVLRVYALASVFSCCGVPLSPDNLFGNYYEKGDLVANKDLASVEGVDDPMTNSNRYVLADITSFFTLLVGIYFPSVTGGFHQEVDALLLASCSMGSVQRWVWDKHDGVQDECPHESYWSIQGAYHMYCVRFRLGFLAMLTQSSSRIVQDQMDQGLFFWLLLMLSYRTMCVC